MPALISQDEVRSQDEMRLLELLPRVEEREERALKEMARADKKTAEILKRVGML